MNSNIVKTLGKLTIFWHTHRNCDTISGLDKNSQVMQLCGERILGVEKVVVQ